MVFAILKMVEVEIFKVGLLLNILLVLLRLSIQITEKLSQDERNQLQAVLKRDKLLRDVDRRRIVATRPSSSRKVYIKFHIFLFNL